jgi:hypothetical protein
LSFQELIGLMVDEDIRRLSQSAEEPGMQVRPTHR